MSKKPTIMSSHGPQTACPCCMIISTNGKDGDQVLSELMERAEKAERERDYLVEEYERAVGCGEQGFAHAAGHLFNAIVNVRCDAKVAERERDELAEQIESARIEIERRGHLGEANLLIAGNSTRRFVDALRAKHWREAAEFAREATSHGLESDWYDWIRVKSDAIGMGE